MRVICFLLAVAISTQAGMVTRRWGRAPTGPPAKVRRAPARAPTGYVAETKTAPTIDGKLAERVWERASVLRLARTLDGARRAPQPTEVRLLRDGDTVYVAVRCAEPFVGKLRASLRGHDGEFWRDDSVEIFLGFGGAHYHFGITAAGSTYDARGKDRAWNAGLRAAVGRAEAAWSVEAAIPLKPMTGEAPPPGRWIANFTRNRYTAGRWEEMAWSPTFSGDSHVPARFGTLWLKEPPPEARRARGPAHQRRDAVEIVSCRGGEGIARFDLAGLPRRARIYRADLRIFRAAPLTGANEEAHVAIEIYPLFREAAAGREPQPRGKPLALREPWLDRFDATEAVQRWAAGEPNGGFFVRTCPLWNAEGTCLDVAYEGEPADVPPPAAGVRAFHRAGQTFVTWKEVGPLITSPKATWGEIKTRLASATDACRYRIYAHVRPITADNIHEAMLLGEVGPLSAWNVNARNKEYLLGQAMVQPDEMGELARDYNGYMHTWTMNSPRMDRYPVPRFVIDEEAGPLPSGTGLYVQNPSEAGQRYYAVVSVRHGVENTKDISASNTPPEPVDEMVGVGVPVRQGKGLWGPYFDYPGQRWVYVQWCAPPLAPRGNMSVNWSVLIPPGAGDPDKPVVPGMEAHERVPAELYFHPDGYSYAQPGRKLLLHSIQIAPHDYPPSGWYGFNDAYGTLKSFSKGVVSNHTQRRIIAFVEWATRSLPIDPEQILCTGADGAAALALSYPDAFAYVWVTGFDRSSVLEPKARAKFAAAWGLPRPDIKHHLGREEWRWAYLDEVALAQTRDLPLCVCLGPSWGREKGYARGDGRFYRAMQKARQPLMAYWGWNGERNRGSVSKYTGIWRGKRITRSTPIPAFSNSSRNSDREASGNACGSFDWKGLVDAKDRFSVTILSDKGTFDLTPRRLRSFRIRPGETLRWQAVSLPGRRPQGDLPEPQSGEVTADARGLVMLKGLSYAERIGGLVVTVTRGR